LLCPQSFRNRRCEHSEQAIGGIIFILL